MRDAVALVVLDLRLERKVPGRGVEVGGHDVPGHAAVAEVVDGREPPREGVGCVVGCRGGDAEAEAVGRCRHCRDGVQGVVDGELGGGGDRGVQVRGAFVDVVAAEDVGEEDGVEFRILEFLGQRDPMVDVFVLPALVFRVLEKARVQMAWCLHGEGVEDPLFLCFYHDGKASNSSANLYTHTYIGESAIQVEKRTWHLE